MSLSYTTFNATDVLSIEINPHPRAGVWFLNWKIKPKGLTQRPIPTADVTAGAGLYGLCFNGQVIYIGSFLGKKGVEGIFAGDVVAARWWTHIGSITARGDCVHIARRSLGALIKNFGIAHSMTAGFLSANNPKLLHTDAGNSAPLRRLLFASELQSTLFDLTTNPIDVLGQFTFAYVRYKHMPADMNSKTLSAHIEAAEKDLIRCHAPICNSTHVPANADPTRISCGELEHLLRQALNLN